MLRALPYDERPRFARSRPKFVDLYAAMRRDAPSLSLHSLAVAFPP